MPIVHVNIPSNVDNSFTSRNTIKYAFVHCQFTLVSYAPSVCSKLCNWTINEELFEKEIVETMQSELILLTVSINSVQSQPISVVPSQIEMNSKILWFINFYIELLQYIQAKWWIFTQVHCNWLTNKVNAMMQFKLNSISISLDLNARQYFIEYIINTKHFNNTRQSENHTIRWLHEMNAEFSYICFEIVSLEIFISS